MGRAFVHYESMSSQDLCYISDMRQKLKLTLEKKHKITLKNEKKSAPLKLTLEPKNRTELKNEPKS